MAITEQNFTDLFRLKIEEEAQLIADVIVNGIEDHALYMQEVGRVAGLVLAKRILNDLEEAFFKEEDDEPVKS